MSELIDVIGHGAVWLSHVIVRIVIVVSTQTTQCVLVTAGHQVEAKERVERNELWGHLISHDTIFKLDQRNH